MSNNIIKDLRARKKLTQKDLAEKVGASQSQINYLEKGERKITKEWADKLAPALDTTPATLLSSAFGIIKEEESRLLALFKDLKDEEKSMFLNFLENYKNTIKK
ncbi:helix-turn-helix domain-containing protein [Bartonella sp. DGB1]|uniref:helix-turn-helix domain-containing protein n=1 Tax=Bartonella sp. DGB1 TaxID=3239807 RepID=UPI003525A086